MNATQTIAKCTIRSHRVAVRLSSHGTYSIGIDGWLAGTAFSAGQAIEEIRESLRMMDTLNPAPKLSQTFRDAVASL